MTYTPTTVAELAAKRDRIFMAAMAARANRDRKSLAVLSRALDVADHAVEAALRRNEWDES